MKNLFALAIAILFIAGIAVSAQAQEPHECREPPKDPAARTCKDRESASHGVSHGRGPAPELQEEPYSSRHQEKEYSRI